MFHPELPDLQHRAIKTAQVCLMTHGGGDLFHKYPPLATRSRTEFKNPFTLMGKSCTVCERK